MGKVQIQIHLLDLPWNNLLLLVLQGVPARATRQSMGRRASTSRRRVSACVRCILSRGGRPPSPAGGRAVRNSTHERVIGKKYNHGERTSFFFNIQSLSFRFLRFPPFSFARSRSLRFSNSTLPSASSSSSPSSPFGSCCCPPPPPTNRHKKTFRAFLEFG